MSRTSRPALLLSCSSQLVYPFSAIVLRPKQHRPHFATSFTRPVPRLWWQKMFNDFHTLSLDSHLEFKELNCNPTVLQPWNLGQGTVQRIEPLKAFRLKNHVKNSRHVKKHMRKRCSSARNIEKHREHPGTILCKCGHQIFALLWSNDRCKLSSNPTTSPSKDQLNINPSEKNIILHRFSFCPARFKNILQASIHGTHSKHQIRDTVNYSLFMNFQNHVRLVLQPAMAIAHWYWNPESPLKTQRFSAESIAAFPLNVTSPW